MYSFSPWWDGTVKKNIFCECDLYQCAGTHLVIHKHKDYSSLTYGPHASLQAAMPCDVAPGNEQFKK